MNQFVGIPSAFFLKEAKNEYTDYRTRLVQELLQNSTDAGATRIDFDFTKEGYSCSDNGRGMTKERMVEALLTMGGTAKESGSTGGFGAAKKLLLFAHKSFTIWSNDTSVEGEGLVYRFVNYGKRIGTRVTAMYTEEFDPTICVVNRARVLLHKCNFHNSCKIYLNGELFTGYGVYPHLKTVEGLGDVYGSKAKVVNDYVAVRHNGLFMFDRYVPELNRNIAIEVKGASVDVFTQNRDGLRGAAALAMETLINQITIDKLSFVKPRTRKFILKGADAFISFMNKTFVLTPEIQAAINQVRMSAGTFNPVSFTNAVAQKVQTSDAATPMDIAMVESITTYVRNNGNKLETDFHFDLADSSYRKVPPRFMPSTGKLKYIMLARLWKICIREVLKANNLDQNFNIGFTFSSSAVASYKYDTGVACYLVNPKSDEIDSGTKQERVIKVLTTAVHEVVHSQGLNYHDERFVLKFHELLSPTLTKAPTWRKLVKMAKDEKV